MTYPTVTQVISPWADFSHIRPDVLNAAAERGTAVHAACTAIATGLFPIFPEQWEGYITSFRTWFDLMVKEVFLAEERMVDMDLGFTGQIDLLCRTTEGLALVDLKTPKPLSRSWRLQLAAYRHLCILAGRTPDRIGSLRLSAEGRPPRMDWYENSAEDMCMFLQALNLWRFFHHT